MTETNVVLKVEGLQKSFAGNKILDGVSFEIDRGQIKVICGPSGSGKSTLLRCLNLLTMPDKGRVWLEG
jgi:polar amino acid transport system ATP-binding protein